MLSHWLRFTEPGELRLGLELTFIQSEGPSSLSMSRAHYPLERRHLHPSSHCAHPQDSGLHAHVSMQQAPLVLFPRRPAHSLGQARKDPRSQ